MICYYYPPLVDVGCRRSVAFSKYFKKHGWIPYVLSVSNPDKTYCLIGEDCPPKGIFIKYAHSIVNPYKFVGKLNGLFTKIMKLLHIDVDRNYFYDFLCIPDPFWGWIPLAVMTGLNIIHKEKIDLIYASCPPFSSGIVSILLKLITHKPSCLDFRDPFALERLPFSGLSKSRKYVDRKIEKWLLNQTDILIVTSEEMREAYNSRYPAIRSKLFTVHNGVDTELVSIARSSPKYDKFTIIYAGMYFYGPGEWDPLFFFDALSILMRKGIIDRSNFQFLFYGEGKKQIVEIATSRGVDNLVVANSRVPNHSVLDIIRRSHLQLLRNRDLVIPSKLYEGIAINVPFLATIPSGEAAELIKEFSPSSYVITSQSADAVAGAIADAIDKYKRNEITANDVSAFLERFSREHLSQKLMNIIDENIRQAG